MEVYEQMPLEPRIRVFKGSFQAASEEDSSGTLLYCKKVPCQATVQEGNCAED